MATTGSKKKWFDNDKTDNPKLMTKKLSDGKESIYLLYNYGYHRENDKVKVDRKKVFLNLYLDDAARTPLERQQNKETVELAKKIKFEKGQQLLEDKEGYRLQSQMNTNFLVYFQNYLDNYTMADVKVISMALRDFKDFLQEEYPHYVQRIEPKQITKDMMIRFTEFLNDTHKGTGAHSVYQRFKKVINHATEKGLFRISPCKGISVPSRDDVLLKEVLSLSELKQLFATHYDGENPEIRRAFALTCFCGIRYCDVKELTYSNVDYSNKVLSFRQNKTVNHSRKSGVNIPLNDALLSIIGTKPDDANDDYIFHLPSSTMCLKALRHWTKRAGIKKHITWHCGRHSFATNILSNGANIKVVAELLGHSSLNYVQVYVRAMDEQKRNAIDGLSDFLEPTK